VAPKTHGRKGGSRVRIIGGTLRSRLIPFPPLPGLRPTPDRVRETVFNWLGQTLEGKTCLDLFAGSGALGFEAASRHARQVVLVENNPQAYGALRANAERLGAANCRIVRADALTWLSHDSARYDVIFLDPPFAAALLPRLWPIIAPRLAEGGVVYVESGAPLVLPPGWVLAKQDRAGVVHYGLAHPEGSPT
jgi:16S rRNA (guanine966-N2)-methyltransferase